MRNLELVRRRRHWSQAQLGQCTRIHQSLISMFERGTGIPTHEQMVRLAHVLDLPPELILQPVVLATEPPTSEAAR